MGLMQQPAVAPGQLIVTPHPALLDGQRNLVWEARAGESLYAILQRNVPEMDGQRWEVCIGGAPVERELWHCVYPKQGQVIEARGGVGKTALMIVAMIALTYFTMGAGAGWIAGAFGVAAGGFAAAAIGAGLFMAGSMLINKVLGPKPAKAGNQQQDSVYSISGARNQLRPYEPIPLLFGRVRITPDLLSKPYTWYEGNDQYLGLLLSAGINVGRIEALYNADTLLTSYEGVQVYHAGYIGMPEQDIPLYSNADTIDGAELPNTAQWVQRTTSADTVRVQIGLEYILGGQGTSGKYYDVGETIEAQYRVTGATNWMSLVTRTFRSSKFDARRATLSRDVERGQYDVRVRMLGQGNYSGKNTQKNDFQWTTLTSVQADEADYTGLSRTGIRIKATGQLNGAPDEIRGVGYADPVPEWNGAAWVTKESSNPGAQCVAYARGLSREGRLLGGMQLSDEQIDLESWKAFTLHCAANGYSYNHYIKEARNHDQVLSAIALAGFGQITWAGGRLGVVWAAQDQPLSGVVNMATIKKSQFQVDYNLINAADGVEYTYIDSADWKPKTLRVPAPGVETMLNPAQVAGEGVSTEQHAARMARWHLAQSLYQYKDISYSTDIEHLSYQRLSLLAMQHDMTQWGYGGRVAAAVNASGTVTLTLDEPVPAPASGNSYIGLRIPGERVYRVLRVKSFTGETKIVELADPWPSDAALPSSAPDNTAHDTLWIYDFKQTPGKRVRVVSIEPESDLKGAAVRVVEESPEFWSYVLTGQYIPPANQSSLQTRPVASSLRITEQQVVQGNTTFTELTATFDITGPVGNILVTAAGQNQELLEVAQTQTRTATWRIPRADAYTIVVRPFGPDGAAGIAVSANYITAGADVPPVLVDLFDIEERSGGVRLYTWGWLADTMRSPDFAGVEIRYIAGTVPSPDWELMTPLGETGYHAVPFEMTVPAAGAWTFACRSRNTGGDLSSGMRTVSLTLGKSLGENLGAITEEQIALQEAVDKEVSDRLLADLQTAAVAAADATAKANAAQAAAIARVDALAGEIGEIVNAPEWLATEDYIAGWLVRQSGNLYRAKVANKNKPPASNPATWEYIGQFASAAEAAAAALQLATTTASNLEAEATRITALQARMPVEGGKLATEARVVSVESAAATATGAVATRVGVLEASMPVEVGKLATSASVTAVETASVARDNAMANSITAVRASLSAGSDNLIANSEFQNLDGWIVGSSGQTGTSIAVMQGTSSAIIPDSMRGIRVQTVAGVTGSYMYALCGPIAGVQPGKRYMASAWLNATVASGGAYLQLRYLDATGVQLSGGAANSTKVNSSNTEFLLDANRVSCASIAPAGAVSARLYARNDFTSSANYLIDVIQPMLEEVSAEQVNPSPFIPSLKAKADATALASLSTEVGIIDGKVALNSTAITQVSGKLGGGSNLLADADFSSGAINSPWSFVKASPGGSTGATVRPVGNEWSVVAGASRTADIGQSDGDTVNPAWAELRQRVGVEAGKVYQLSVYAGNHRCGGALFVRYYNADGAEIGNSFATRANMTATGKSGGKLLSDYERYRHNMTPPAGTATVEICVRKLPTQSGTSSFIFLTRVQFCEVANLTQDGVPWTDGSGGMSATITDMKQVSTGIDGRLKAKMTLASDVNGNVSGMVSENDGERSSFSILATVFRVISATTGVGMEWQDGYLRMWKGAAQILIGHTFGPGDLLFWAGPNVGAAGATKANAKWWLDTSGESYFAGRVLQGVLRNFLSNTTISTSASVTTGSNPRNGKEISAAGRFQYQEQQSYPAFSSVISLGAGSTSATVALERRYGAAAWVELTRATFGGSDEVLNETDGPSVITQYISGQLFATDSASTSASEYRTRVISRSVRQHSVVNPGTVPAAVRSQYQSIETLE